MVAGGTAVVAVHKLFAGCANDITVKKKKDNKVRARLREWGFIKNGFSILVLGYCWIGEITTSCRIAPTQGRDNKLKKLKIIVVQVKIILREPSFSPYYTLKPRFFCECNKSTLSTFL